MLCSAICFSTGKKCNYIGKHITSEGINVCKIHINLKINDNDIVKKLYKEKQERSEKKLKTSIINDKLIIKHSNKIPLRNKDGLIVDFAFVSKEDYNNVMKYKWYKTHEGYAISKKARTTMHQLILGKSKEGYVIDHINHNKLDNRRNNIFFNTIDGNCQNKVKSKKTSSKYLGVSWNTERKKWCAASGRKFLGHFTDEKEAAIKYDTYVLLKYGKHASTNKLITFDEVKNNDINSLFTVKQRILPENIRIKRNIYEIRISYKNILYRAQEKNIEDAQNKLLEFKKTIEEVKNKEHIQHLNTPITRNKNGQAILVIRNKDGKQIDETIVDENRWHELVQFSWVRTKKGYYIARINGKQIQLHRYLLDAKDGDIVDHINNNGNDVSINTLDNLRINTNTGNSHNKSKNKNASSKFYGVSYKKSINRWRASISKEHIEYYLGCYKIEIQAAIAYNIKAKELYNNFANLNIIPEEDYNTYYEEIYNNIKKLNNNKTIEKS